MKEIASKLSSGFPFLRVDFYETDNSVYIGEMTLYPAGGLGRFTNDDIDKMLGGMIELPR